MFDQRMPTKMFLEKWHYPIDAMARASVAAEEHISSNEAISPSSTTTQIPWQTPKRSPARDPLITAHTFPSPNYNPWSAVKAARALESNYTSTFLPDYDENTTFRLQAPFIYTSKTNNLPQYQLHQEYTREGLPARLHIRRLKPSEMRSSSVPAVHAQNGPRIRYDAEGTLYTVTTDEMKGHRKMGTLSDSIQMSSGKTLWGGQFTRIWRVTHPSQWRKRQKGKDEFDKHLLFAMKKGTWEDCNGEVVAREERGSSSGGSARMLEIEGLTAMDATTRDLVVACWVMRIWIGEGIRWEGV